MGCCFSRPEGPNSPYPGGGGPSASARAINVPSAAAASPSLRPMTAAAHASNGAPGDIVNDNTAPSSPTLATQHRQHQQHHGIQDCHSSSLLSSVSALRRGGGDSHGHLGSLSRRQPSHLAQHINKPLRRRPWTSRNRVWTRHAIDRERIDFFDTRVTGRSEVWQTLHAALEVLWEADLAAAAAAAAAAPEQKDQKDQEGGPEKTAESGSVVAAAAASAADQTTQTKTLRKQSSATTETEEIEVDAAAATVGSTAATIAAELAEALATAQSMIGAADITLPTGDLAQGAYDVLGNFYALPAWIVSDPVNLDNDPMHDLAEVKGTFDGDDEDDEDDDYDDDDDDDDDDGDDGNQTEGALSSDDDGTDTASRHRRRQRRQSSVRRRRAEKGKAVADDSDDDGGHGDAQIAVRARLSVTARDVVVRLGRDDTVRTLSHRVCEEAGFPHKTRVRIAYLGKVLQEGTSLVAQGWKEGHVVNALVFEPSLV